MNRAFDDEYLDALQRHDPTAEDDLVRCFSNALKVSLRCRLRRTQAVEDVTQETLFRVLTFFRCGHKLRAAASLPAFVKSVSSNVSRELTRVESRSQPLDSEFEDTADSHENPELAILAEEQAQTVRLTLRQLSPKDQHILESLFLQESEKDEICDELCTSRDHFRVLLHRARQRFRAIAERTPDATLGADNKRPLSSAALQHSRRN